MLDTQAAASQPIVVRSEPVFPLPALNGQRPISLVFDHADPGIEIAYEVSSTPDAARVRPSTRESTLYAIPRAVPVFAVSDGKIIYAREHMDGFAVVVAHRSGWATYYSRLDHMFAMPTDRRPRRETTVSAGDMLGYVGKSQSPPLRPFRFELWRCNRDRGYDAVDPIRYMHRWRVMRWNDSRAKPTTSPHRLGSSP